MGEHAALGAKMSVVWSQGQPCSSESDSCLVSCSHQAVNSCIFLERKAAMSISGNAGSSLLSSLANACCDGDCCGLGLLGDDIGTALGTRRQLGV